MIEPDSLIASISLWNPKPLNRIYYREPFIGVWCLTAALWFQFDFNQELGVFLFVATLLGQALVWLSTIWSCRAKCLITCDTSAKLSLTRLIRVTPQPNNVEEELIELRRRRHEDETELWFQFQKVNFYYSPETATFGRRTYPIKRPLSSFTTSKGGDWQIF